MKRIPDVIEIFHIVRKQIPAKLVLIGDGPDRAGAEWLVHDKGLSSDVLFLGKQNQVQEILSAADVHCCLVTSNPSDWRRWKEWPVAFRRYAPKWEGYPR